MSPSPSRTFFLRLLFQIKNLSKQDLEELQSFAFHLVHLGMARAGYSAEEVAEGGNPYPSPWTGSSEPGRDESTPVGTALLQDGPPGLPALLLPHATDGDGGACFSKGLSCDGKAPDPFLSLVPLEKYELNGRAPAWLEI